MQVTGGTLYAIHADQTGQPVKMTNATGTTVWQRTAQPFGETYAESGSIATVLRFPGQVADAATSTHYNMARDYDPSLGRYLQSDPIGLAGGWNTYGYVGGNPINAIDPDGRLAWWIIPAGFALWELGSQVYDNWLHCRDLSDVHNYQWGEVGMAFGSGLIGGGIGSGAARFALRGASSRLKGLVGEGFARAAIATRGGRVLAETGRRAPMAREIAELGSSTSRAGRARPDFVYKTITGRIRVVEAKFSTNAPRSVTSGLTGPQRALRNELGDAFEIFRVTSASAANAAGVAGATAGGAISQVEP